MSHWTKVKTKLKNKEFIVKALSRMGLEAQVGNHQISQYGTTEKAEIKLDSAVGLSEQEDGTYAMVGDFYHSHNQKLRKFYGNNNGFAKELSQKYAIEEAISNLEDQQFFCSNNEEGTVGEDGFIRMSFEKFTE